MTTGIGCLVKRNGVYLKDFRGLTNAWWSGNVTEAHVFIGPEDRGLAEALACTFGAEVREIRFVEAD